MYIHYQDFIYILEFRTSQALGNKFNVFIDGKPIQVIVYAFNFARLMVHTLFSKPAPRRELKSPDFATTKDYQSLVTAVCVSLRLKVHQNQ
jgi:hypothetical protein